LEDNVHSWPIVASLSQSVLAVESIQDEMQAVAWRLHALRDNLMAIMVDLLATYAEHCNETYKGV
jgi:hypothetical protein